MEQVATYLTIHNAFFSPRVFSLSEYSLLLANSRQLSSTLIDFVHKLFGSIRRKKCKFKNCPSCLARTNESLITTPDLTRTPVYQIDHIRF